MSVLFANYLTKMGKPRWDNQCNMVCCIQMAQTDIGIVCCRAHHGPVCGFLVFLLQITSEPFASNCPCVYNYVFHCDVLLMR